MIELELRAADATGHYTTVAALRVDADGRATFTGRRGLFDTRAAVVDARTRQPVRFKDDPETWARNLATIYRAGELVPVITHDDRPNPPVERAGHRGLHVPDPAVTAPR